MKSHEAKRLFRQMEDAAASEGKSLGEWLYEALAEPFSFRGHWGVAGPDKKLARKRYRKAADAFADRISQALAPAPEEESGG